jgi:hypothetical protein
MNHSHSFNQSFGAGANYQDNKGSQGKQQHQYYQQGYSIQGQPVLIVQQTEP